MWHVNSSSLVKVFPHIPTPKLHNSHLSGVGGGFNSSFSSDSSSLLVSNRGDAERLPEDLGCCLGRSGVACVEGSCCGPCFILLCCLSPFSEAGLKSHWSQERALATVSTSLGFTVEKFCFLCENSSFLLAFLLKAEGLAFFLIKVTGLVSLLLVSKEKVG